MANADPRTIGITILNWNGIADTLECIASLQKSNYPHFSVFVLDNGSTDDSVRQLQALGDRITLIVNDRNDGFSGGMNKVAAAAIEQGVDFVFLLNNDTTVPRDCLARLIETHGELGDPTAVISPVLCRAEDLQEIEHAGHLWDSDRCRLVPAQHAHSWRNDAANEVDHIVAAALLVPSVVIREHGLFDERFFLNYEETDWEFRVRRAGIRLFVEPRAVVRHKVSQSFTSAKKAYYIERNRLLWIHKNFSGAEKRRVWRKMVVPRMLHIVNRIITKSVACGLLRLTGRPDKLQRMQERLLRNRMAARGIRAYFRGEFGPAPDHLHFGQRSAQ